MRIFAHNELGVQHHFFMQYRQIVKGAHRHIQFISHTLHVQQNLRRIFFQQNPEQSSDHISLPFLTRYPVVANAPKPRPPCAWQSRRLARLPHPGWGCRTISTSVAPFPVPVLFWRDHYQPRPASLARRCTPPPADSPAPPHKSPLRAPARVTAWIADSRSRIPFPPPLAVVDAVQSLRPMNSG